jgi:hypothetical protein
MALILWCLLWGTTVTKHIMAQKGEANYNRACEKNTVSIEGSVNTFLFYYY